MYSLSKHLLNDEWTLVVPDMINSFEIKVFDDGNEKYKLHEKNGSYLENGKIKIAF